MGKFVVKQTGGGYKFDLRARNGEVIASSEIYTTEAACLKGVESVRVSCAGEIDDLTATERAEVKHPKFELYRDKAGQYRFRLKARNGEIVAASEGYTSRGGCLNGIASVKENAPDAELAR